MKKVLTGLVVVAMILSLTACSQDVYSRLGAIMGSMGNNVYGIEPNMAQVDAATENLSSSVTVEGNTATVDLKAASSIISAVADIKNSETKTEALKAQLSQPVASTDEEKAAVQAALQSEVTSIKDKVEELTSSLSGEQKALVDSVKDALTSITVSDDPTLAELATVAVISKIANTASEIAADPAVLEDPEKVVEIADAALSSIDTLKVVSEVAGIDVLGDVSLPTLLAGLSGSKGPEDEETELSQIQKMLSGMIAKYGELLYKDYSGFMAQAKAAKAAYDLLAAVHVTPLSKLEENPKPVSGISNVDHDLEIDDFIRYAVLSCLAECDNLAPKATKLVVEKNTDFLTSGSSWFDDFKWLEGTEYGCEDALKELCANLDVEKLDDIDWSAVVAMNFSKLYMMAGTMQVILCDSGYELSSLLALAGDTSEWAEAICDFLDLKKDGISDNFVEFLDYVIVEAAKKMGGKA